MQGEFFGKLVTVLIHSCTSAFGKRLASRPNAWAAVRPADETRLFGSVKLYQTTAGVLVVSEFWGLPETKDNSRFILTVYGEEAQTPPAQPGQTPPHPQPGQSAAHSGRKPSGRPEEKGEERRCLAEFPALQANKGFAWLVFLTSRFTIREVMGGRVVLCPAKGEQEELAAGIIH